MNELVQNNTSVLTTRTPALIAAEINDIKGQTRKMILYNSIEIGRRLVEAKSMLSHGEWGNWLENSVDYSQRTAENLIRIFEEYGSDQITMLTDNAKSQALANLSYTQAVLLLGVPEEEREAFIAEYDVENMSTRELQQAIRERDHALADKERAESEKAAAIEEAKSAENKIKSLITEKDKLKKELEKANDKADKELIRKQAELDKSKMELENLNKRIKELETASLEVQKGATDEDISRIKAEAAETYEKDIALLKVEKEQAEKRIKELEIKITQQNNAAALRYQVYFDEVVKAYQELLKALSDIKDADSAAYDRYKNAVFGLLSKMAERLN